MDADREQIAEVLIRYATGIDSKDWPLLRSCWTDEIDVDYQQLGRFTSADALTDVAQPVPLHLRNAPTPLMKDLEYGKGYRYAHDEAAGVSDMTCLPAALEGRQYYQPTERGFEKEIRRRLDLWAESKKRR